MEVRDGCAPIVIAHRGVPGLRLEHTRPSYLLAHRAGRRLHRAGCRQHQGRRARRAPRERDRRHHRCRRAARVRRPQASPRSSTASSHTGWFTEDFTLAEIKTLRTKERIPELRPGNVALGAASSRSSPSTRCSTSPRSAGDARGAGRRVRRDQAPELLRVPRHQPQRSVDRRRSSVAASTRSGLHGDRSSRSSPATCSALRDRARRRCIVS